MNVLHVSTFSPTACGIATYTEDLIQHLSGVKSSMLRMEYQTDIPSRNSVQTIAIQQFESYVKAIDVVNGSKVNVVSLQHEFGIYGGSDGQYVTQIVEGIRKPIVTTLHTTSSCLPLQKQEILKKLVQKSDRVVVLTDESADLILEQFAIPAEKISVIRHGIPKTDFAFPEKIPLRSHYACDLVFVSAGHLRPSKGYDVALVALAKLKKCGTRFLYLILGTSQPQWDVDMFFQIQLENRIKELGLQDCVIWIRRYLQLTEFLQYIQAADIGLVTYTEPDQISTGILPMMLGCGRPVIATNFDGAKSIAKSVKGLYLAEINNPNSIFDKIREVVARRDQLREIMPCNYAQTRSWLWKNSAQKYREVFLQVAE